MGKSQREDNKKQSESSEVSVLYGSGAKIPREWIETFRMQLGESQGRFSWLVGWLFFRFGLIL